ncbi:MAG: response regulator, partial [Chloroflexota bacterium]|nr:response regulator [Chloroflexota bacterium]
VVSLPRREVPNPTLPGAAWMRNDQCAALPEALRAAGRAAAELLELRRSAPEAWRYLKLRLGVEAVKAIEESAECLSRAPSQLRHAEIRRGLDRLRACGCGMRVLLIDHNQDTQVVDSTILRHHGFEVSFALNGEEGVARAEEELPDAIVTNGGLPLLDGWEVTRRLSADTRTCHIPVVLKTAEYSPAREAEARDAGAYAYLVKPFEPVLLVEVIVSALLDGTGNSPASASPR